MVILLEDDVLQFLELFWVRSENTLNDVVVELLLIELLGLIKEHEMLLEVLHHVPLAEQVSRLVKDLFNAVAHRGIKVGDDSTWLFPSELHQLLEEPHIVV